ncbi:MAG TPA: glycosyltransferase [Fibrobacteria bacterium]|nr:glycosyltransferase [Fibrobacteria bacterium]
MSSASMAGIADVVALILTYGRRRHHVEKVVRALREGSIRPGRILVVDNGSSEPYPAEEGSTDPEVRRLDLGANLGSAGGYRAGLVEAASMAGLVWLLDDDNCPEVGCLESLLESRRQLGPCSIVVANRPDRPEFQEILLRGGSRPIRRNSFMAFHWRGTPGGSHLGIAPRNGCLPLAYFGYGGALVPSEVVRRGILPKSELFVYHDDSDWSQRAIGAGFDAWLVPSAVIQDLESPCGGSSGPKVSPLFSDRTEARRLWYATRNRAWVERGLGHGGFEWHFNVALWAVLQSLRVAAIERRPLRAFRRGWLTWKAFRLGASGRLPPFPQEGNQPAK